MNPIVAQAVGVVAMFFNIFSYQQKSAKRIIAFQLFGALFFAINYFMLGAYIGTLLNGIGLIRAILFLKKDTFRTDRVSWLVVFAVAYVGAYLLTFTVFDKPPTVFNLVIESLPVVAMFATHLAYRYNSPKTIRRFCLISSVSWLIFNVIHLAIGAILCEVFSLASILIAMVRLDKQEK